MIRVLVVDDQDLIRSGLRMLCESAPDLEIVGEAQNGGQAVRLAEQHRPDVVMMDLRMPVMDGIAAARQILTSQPAARIVALTTFDDDDHLYPALAAGMVGLLTKDASPAEILDAIRRAHAGENPFTPAVLQRVIGRALATDPVADAEVAALDHLTDREREVLQHLGAGLANSEISGEMFISVTTVKTHIASVMAKTGTRNRIHLALLAARAGLTPPRPGTPSGPPPP